MPIAISLIFGIACFDIVPNQPVLWLTIAAVAIFTAYLERQSAVVSAAGIALATVLLGVTLAQSVYFRHSHNDIGSFASDQPALAQVRVVIDHAPTLVYPQSPTGRPLPPKQVIVSRAVSIHGHDGWLPADGTLLVTLSHPNPWIHLGQHVEAAGEFGHLVAASNPGQLDWVKIYRQRGILASLQVGRAENIEILSDDGVGMVGWLQQEARHLISAGFTVRRMADYALLRALVLGDSNPDSREVQEAFAQVGLAYQLSVSGMHIVVLVACAYFLCRLNMLSPRWTIAISIAVVLLYGTVALPSTSARRAVFICVAFLAAPLFTRQGDKLQLLSLAAIGLLVLDPMDLQTAGFQLGFVTVAGLALFAPRFLRWTSDALRRRQNESRWKRWRRQSAIAIRAWVTISIIAWIVSLPLVTAYFGQISPWAVFAGLFMFPLVLASLLGGWAKIILTLLWPSIGSIAARGVEIPVFAMRLLAVRFTHLPGASIAITPPTTWMIVAYYGAMVALLIPWKRAWQTQFCRGAAGVGFVAFLFFICTNASALPVASTVDLTVTLLDIGAGQTAVVTAPGESGITLIDCGSDSIGDVARSVLLPYLHTIDRRSVGRVFLSHSDYDHISALSSITSMLTGPVYTSSYFANFALRDPPAESLLRKLDANRQSPTILRQFDHVPVGPNASIEVLWPPDDTNYNVNDTGLVLRLNFGGKSILFPADIQATAMRKLLDSGASLRADVLVAAHHGSSEVTTPAFIRAVNPQFIVASNSAPLTGKQRLFDELVGEGPPLYRTSRFGAITIHLSDKSTVTVTTYKSPSPH